MKKALALIMALAMLFSLAACGEKTEPAPTQAPATEAPAPEVTEAPAEETPAEETPAEETPAEETPAEETPAEETPAEETPAEETPAEAAADYSGLEKIELVGADSTGKGAAGQIFGETVAAKVDEITGGQLTIDYHPNGDLGGDADLLRQAQAGDIDIVVCQTAPTVSFIPEMAVFDLPMVFAKYDGETIDKVLNGDNEFHTALGEAYNAAGYHLLGFMQNATYRLTTSNRELKDLASFKGMQIRTMENANHMAFWSAIGAEPTPLAWAEVFQALQTGMLDAQENAADTCVGANFQDVQKYLACTNHILYANQILINNDSYNALPEAYQKALDQAVAEALEIMNPQLKKIDQDNKKILEDGGMTIIEYEDSFYDEVLALDGVKTLYAEIDEKIGGLGTKLQAALEENAGAKAVVAVVDPEPAEEATEEPAEETEETKGLTVDDIESIQATTDGTIYGTGVVKVEVTYKEGVDLSGVTAESYVLEDRGTMTPDFGEVKIASAEVDGQVVTLTMSNASAATEANGLVYTGDQENRDGPRQRNAFGVYCTNPWYRDVEGKIHFGSEDTEEYLANTTGQGYQARACLELKLRHADEEPEAALCLADELGQYTDANKWLPTIDLQFGEGEFNSFEDLGIEIRSTAADVPDLTADEFVKGFAYIPEDYDPANGIVFTLQGQGISYWRLEDGTDDYGTTFMYDTATSSWKSTGAIVVNIQDRSSTAKAFGAWFDVYDFVVDDCEVMKYFIDTYGVTGNIVVQGNSRGTMACTTIIKALAGRPYDPKEQDAQFEGEKNVLLDKERYDFTVDTFVCQNGQWGGWNDFSAEDFEACAATGLRVWCIDGEQDTNNIENIATYIEACKAVGHSDEWIAKNVRLTGLPSDIFAYWGESDHSVTRIVGWYFADENYLGPDVTVGEDGELVYASTLSDGDLYTLPGRGSAGANSKNGYEYTFYDDNFHAWALRVDREELAVPAVVEETEEEAKGLTVDDIESIHAVTDETIYGTGVVQVAIRYKEGVDYSGVTADSYILEDRGSLSPDFGQIKIASVDVDQDFVLLTISGESQATEANGLVYTGDEAQRDGPRQRNAFGIYCTGAWYRDVEGKIHYGSEDTDEYVANETRQGYQTRASLELKLRHADEPEEAALCLADENGQYTDANKWLPTTDRQFGEGHFLNLYDLQIPSTANSEAVKDGTADDYVQGYYYVPEDYDPANGLVVTLQGQGISFWKLEDGTNDAGTGIRYDSATTSWADNGAIVVNIHDRSSTGKAFGTWFDVYDFVEDDSTVMKYFIDEYGITGPIVIQGNSRGTMACAMVIKALAGQPYNPKNQDMGGSEPEDHQLDKEKFNFDIDAYICQNGSFGYQYDEEDWAAVAATGLRVWAFDGEQDSNNIETIAKYSEMMTELKGEEWVKENVRLTGYTSNLYYPWGESDHSTTRINGWYFDDAAYYGPDLYIDENGEIAYNTKLADGDTYTLEGRGAAATNSKNGYEYTVYDELFQEWALKEKAEDVEVAAPVAEEPEEETKGLTVDDIESIQAYTDETIYGTGVVKVVVTYKEGVELGDVTAENYILEDRGTMTPDFGEVKIASAEVDGQVVTLTMSNASAATEANGLVYTGDEAQRDGPRQRNAFGIYCTNPWYRDVEGKIHFGTEETDEYVPNETNQGYQARACLELKLRHADEEPEAALCLADELGQYTDANKWLPTIDQQFGEGAFLNLYDLQIPSTSAAAPDGSGDDYVQGYYFIPEDYDPANGIVFTIQGQGISYWKLPDGTNNAGCGIMYDSATTSWADNGAIVVNIHDRSSSAAKFGEYDEAGYDYVIDDVNVMKYFIEKYEITGPIVIQGNSRGTMASSTIIRALAGRPYGINGNEENQGTLDKEEYPFMISAYICNNGGFRGSQEDYEAIAALGMKVWAFDGEQDSNNIENIANYKEACRTVGLSEEWIEENVRLTGYTSNIYYPWGESDHSTTRMNGWYFDDAAYYGPDLYIDENGEIVYNTMLGDGDTYTLECRGAAATNSKNGYEYTVYVELFQEWALK